MKARAVFLDRDGVLNDVVFRNGVSQPPADAASMRILPGAAEAAESLRAAGYLCICVTNQPDVARGTRSPENVRAMNERVRRSVPLDDLLVCPHDDGDGCRCRKPKPGMLLEAAAKWGLDLGESWMVGDRRTDVLAGKAAGCRTVFIGSGDGAGADAVCADLASAARYILESGTVQ